MHFIPPAAIGATGQVLTATDNAGHTGWLNPSSPILPPNGIQIFFSKQIGSDITGDGSYTNPYASINFAYTAAGTPTVPVFIIGLDAEVYDEQLVLNSSLKFIIATYANLNYTGAGDAITVLVAGAGFPVIFGTISAASGNALSNPSNEVVIIEVGSLQQGNVVNSGSGIIILQSLITTVDFINTGAGQFFYNVTTRLSGTDTAGVHGLSAQGASGPFNISGLNYPTVDGASGNVMTTNGLGSLTFQPTSLSTNSIQIYVSQQIGSDITGNGSFTNPFATIGHAITVAGIPTFPVQITIMDGNLYDEQIVIPAAYIYIIGRVAQLIYSGVGDAITINGSVGDVAISLGNIGATGGGNAITINAHTDTYLTVGTIINGNILNNGNAVVYMIADYLSIDINNTAGGSVKYLCTTRFGIDGTNVFGVSPTGSSSPTFGVNTFTASGLQYPTADAASGTVVTTNGLGVLSLQPIPALPLPYNGAEIYVSKLTGNDANSGSFTAPLATLNAALTLAGSPTPTAPIVIVVLDAATYDEQLNFAPSTENLFFQASSAQINFSGVGDAVTIGLNCKIFMQFASIANSGTGTAITNNGGEFFGYIDVIQSTGVAINHVGPGGACLIQSSIALQGDILLAGGGNVLYNTQLRTGTDATGVVGINILGTSGPWQVQGQLTASGLNYPATDSTAGNVVTTDGAGNLTLQPPSGFTSINTQTFTSSGTYTPSAGLSYATVEVIGSGGGGGGVDSAIGSSAAAGGGGAGAYARSTLTAATIGASQVITIGAGGAGGAAGNNNGSNGASSSFGALVTADGGSGGFGASASVTVPALGIYGAGGGAGTGQLVTNGDSGFLGVGWGAGLIGIGGQGGNSFYGIGGEQLVNLPGANGFNFGSGGGGAGSGNTGNAAGGNGADGVVIVTEFISA